MPGTQMRMDRWMDGWFWWDGWSCGRMHSNTNPHHHHPLSASPQSTYAAHVFLPQMRCVDHLRAATGSHAPHIEMLIPCASSSHVDTFFGNERWRGEIAALRAQNLHAHAKVHYFTLCVCTPSRQAGTHALFGTHARQNIINTITAAPGKSRQLRSTQQAGLVQVSQSASEL